MSPRRVVSLVPSLTEAVALSAPGVLVGATDYCRHPSDLDVARVGGSKYPTVDAVLALAPDLVLANVEENRESDVADLRAARVPVWVSYPRTVPEALDALAELLDLLDAPRRGWLADARRVWASPHEGPTRRAVVPVWRRPWVVLGGDTFASDLLYRLGIVNVCAGATDRYPRPSLRELNDSGAQLVVLPDEPYAFSAQDGPEAFPGLPCALVSGRHLTWYGPSLVEARRILTDQLVS